MTIDYDHMAARLSALSNEERTEISSTSVEASLKEHAAFRDAFACGQCYLCGKPLATFSAPQPCLHWLLKPKGFKKKHLPSVVALHAMLQTETYLRWIASTDGIVQNINDLSDEGSGKLREVTIRYKHLEWAFSCGISDLRGHRSASHSNFPHFHFQMRVDGRPFINYNDFHLPLHERDVASLELSMRIPDIFKIKFPAGEGMDELLQPRNFDTLLANSAKPSEQAKAGLEISSLVIADEGHAIDGSQLADLIEEARKSGVTVASLLHRLPNVKATTVISPGPAVVEQAPRKGRGA